jgi:hypothetical protein
VKWIGHTTNLGWSGNRNSLVQAARGEFVILLGDDDRLKPGALDRLRSVLPHHPQVAAFGFGYDIIDEAGAKVLTYCPNRSVRYGLKAGNAWKELFYYDSLPMWSHHPFTLCCRREIALRFPYNRAADIGDDALFLFELVAAGEVFLATGENLFDWRNAFAANGTYANLSSTAARSTKARRLIWAELVRRPKLPDEIRTILREPLFAQRFLELDPGQVTRLLELSDSDLPAAISYVTGLPAEVLPVKRVGKILRHVRAVRYMGLSHLWNAYRNLNSRRRYRSL